MSGVVDLELGIRGLPIQPLEDIAEAVRAPHPGALGEGVAEHQDPRTALGPGLAILVSQGTLGEEELGPHEVGPGIDRQRVVDRRRPGQGLHRQQQMEAGGDRHHDPKGERPPPPQASLLGVPQQDVSDDDAQQ